MSLLDVLRFSLVPDGRYGGAVVTGRLELHELSAIAALWDFNVAGGSCGVVETDAFVASVEQAIDARLPLVSGMATGGTRLTEGMRALVGIPRMALALDRLRAARLPHISVADAPTTGGVWVAVGCSADLRVGVAEATVAFSGPRVVEAMTGRPPAPGAGTAESALSHGLLDAVLPVEQLPGWLGRALRALTVDPNGRSVSNGPTTGALSSRLLDDPIGLRGADETVSVSVGGLRSWPEQPAVVALLAAEPGAMVSAAGFDLLARAAGLADSLDLPLVVGVDTIGGDPHDERVPAAILAATRAVLACRAPTLAVVTGAGGSGGALAGAVTDAVLVGSDGWFAALAPVGAQAALRRPMPEVIDLLRLRPEHLLADGFADAGFLAGDEPAVVGRWLGRLADEPSAERLRRRAQRWSDGLPRHSE